MATDILARGIASNALNKASNVTTADIKSGTQEAGKVIVSDGHGGADWGDAGSNIDLLALDSDIIPDAANTRTIGAMTKPFINVYTNKVGFATSEYTWSPAQILSASDSGLIFRMGTAQGPDYTLNDIILQPRGEYTIDLAHTNLNGNRAFTIGGLKPLRAVNTNMITNSDQLPSSGTTHGKGINIPNTYSWTANKTMATVEDIMENFAPAYDSTAIYAVGDLCSYQGKLYQCNTEITVAENWNSAHWTATTVAELIVGAIRASY